LTAGLENWSDGEKKKKKSNYDGIGRSGAEPLFWVGRRIYIKKSLFFLNGATLPYFNYRIRVPIKQQQQQQQQQKKPNQGSMGIRSAPRVP